MITVKGLIESDSLSFLMNEIIQGYRSFYSVDKTDTLEIIKLMKSLGSNIQPVVGLPKTQSGIETIKTTSISDLRIISKSPDGFISWIIPAAVKIHSLYGVSPVVMVAQACVESQFGLHGEYYNLMNIRGNGNKGSKNSWAVYDNFYTGLIAYGNLFNRDRDIYDEYKTAVINYVLNGDDFQFIDTIANRYAPPSENTGYASKVKNIINTWGIKQKVNAYGY